MLTRRLQVRPAHNPPAQPRVDPGAPFMFSCGAGGAIPPHASLKFDVDLLNGHGAAVVIDGPRDAQVSRP